MPAIQCIQSELGYADSSLLNSLQMAIVDFGLEEQCTGSTTTQEKFMLLWNASFDRSWNRCVLVRIDP